MGNSATELPPAAVDPTIAPEHNEPSATAEADAYDFKEYDLREYDVGEFDKSHYDFGAYDEFGNGGPDPVPNYEDEFGPAVPAETGTEEAQVEANVSIMTRDQTWCVCVLQSAWCDSNKMLGMMNPSLSCCCKSG